jgi:hypothetical protein
MKDTGGNPMLEVIKAEDLRTEQSEPKVKRRIIFDTDDESPF